MKNKGATIFLVSLLAISCNKPLPDYSGGTFDYTVTGISDTSIAANDYLVFNPLISVTSGNVGLQPVTVTFRGVPSNVLIQKDSFSFHLNYYLMDSFFARNAIPGIYPVQAIFTSASTTAKTYNFNLTVKAPVNRVAMIVGSYYPSNTCGNTQYISCEIDSIPGAPGQIRFIDRIGVNSFDTSYGTVDCCTNTFIIPAQNVQGATVQGSGSFNDETYPYKRATINKTVATDTTNYSCIITLSQS